MNSLEHGSVKREAWLRCSYLVYLVFFVACDCLLFFHHPVIASVKVAASAFSYYLLFTSFFGEGTANETRYEGFGYAILILSFVHMLIGSALLNVAEPSFCLAFFVLLVASFLVVSLCGGRGIMIVVTSVFVEDAFLLYATQPILFSTPVAVALLVLFGACFIICIKNDPNVSMAVPMGLMAAIVTIINLVLLFNINLILGIVANNIIVFLVARLAGNSTTEALSPLIHFMPYLLMCLIPFSTSI